MYHECMKIKFKKGTEARAEKLAKEAKRAPELRRLQSVLLGCKGLTAESISIVVGLKPNYIRQVWMKCRREGIESLVGEKRGQSRGRAHLSLEEEKELLNEFKEKAESGTIVTAKAIQIAHCQKVGKTLKPSVTYRLLKRHRWRKITPRPEHPKHDPDKMKNFKEAIFPPGFDPYESEVYFGK